MTGRMHAFSVCNHFFQISRVGGVAHVVTVPVPETGPTGTQFQISFPNRQCSGCKGKTCSHKF